MLLHERRACQFNDRLHILHGKYFGQPQCACEKSTEVVAILFQSDGTPDEDNPDSCKEALNVCQPSTSTTASARMRQWFWNT
jgi:hypothetical protein